MNGGPRPPQPRVLAIAHRAGNSLEAMRAASVAGVDLVEADVHAFRGRLEVRHLKSLGPLPLRWDRWELLPASASTLVLHELLAELLDAVEPRAQLMLDLKGVHPRLGMRTAAALRELAPEHPVVVCSRHWWMLDDFAAEEAVRTVCSAGSQRQLQRLRRRLTRRPTYGVSVHRRLLDARVVDELHRGAEVVMTWPVHDPRALEEVLALGVSGVISDDVRLLRRLRDRSP